MEKTNSETNKLGSDDGYSEHLRRKRSAWRRWSGSEENTGKERDDIYDAMITLVGGLTGVWRQLNVDQLS